MRQLKTPDYVNSIGAQSRTKKGPKERIKESRKDRAKYGTFDINTYLMNLMQPAY